MKLYATFRIWLPLALVALGLSGLVYGVVQQNYRELANDPQIQMAHDAADSLDGGASPALQVGGPKIDAGKSLAPYLIIFDENHKVVASNVVLSGVVPEPPSGVFDTAKSQGENRFTWQPRGDVRAAAVLVHRAKFGYVMAARSLREVELRESYLAAEVGLVLLAVLLSSFIVMHIVLAIK